jgi:hypothetical protein
LFLIFLSLQIYRGYTFLNTEIGEKMAQKDEKSKKVKKGGVFQGKVVGVSSYNCDDVKDTFTYEDLKDKAEGAGAKVSGILHKKVFALIATVGVLTSPLTPFNC